MQARQQQSGKKGRIFEFPEKLVENKRMLCRLFKDWQRLKILRSLFEDQNIKKGSPGCYFYEQ